MHPHLPRCVRELLQVNATTQYPKALIAGQPSDETLMAAAPFSSFKFAPKSVL